MSITPVGAVLAIIALSGLLFVVAFVVGRRQRTVEATIVAPPPPNADVVLEELRRAAEPALLVDGDLHVRSAFAMPDRLAIRGSLVVSRQVRFDAPTEVFGNVTLDEGARAEQPLVVHGDFTLGGNARAPCCFVQGDVLLGAGSTIEGSLECRALYVAGAPEEETQLVELVRS